jgi:hypothetical protein
MLTLLSARSLASLGLTSVDRPTGRKYAIPNYFRFR